MWARDSLGEAINLFPNLDTRLDGASFTRANCDAAGPDTGTDVIPVCVSGLIRGSFSLRYEASDSSFYTWRHTKI
jgi:hypothetical protein